MTGTQTTQTDITITGRDVLTADEKSSGRKVVELPHGWYATVRTERDEYTREPWKDFDGHGVVSEWTSRDKRPGERVLTEDHESKRFYDVEASMAVARKDGWGCGNHDRHPTKGERAACGVEQDFQRMRAWCRDEWEWIGVIVTLYDAEGEEVADSSCWGIESDSDYWADVAADLIMELASGHVLPN